jgi:hypothetical protein
MGDKTAATREASCPAARFRQAERSQLTSRVTDRVATNMTAPETTRNTSSRVPNAHTKAAFVSPGSFKSTLMATIDSTSDIQNAATIRQKSPCVMVVYQCVVERGFAYR